MFPKYSQYAKLGGIRKHHVNNCVFRRKDSHNQAKDIKVTAVQVKGANSIFPKKVEIRQNSYFWTSYVASK